MAIIINGEGFFFNFFIIVANKKIIANIKIALKSTENPLFIVVMLNKVESPKVIEVAIISPTTQGRTPFKNALTPANLIRFAIKLAIIKIITKEGRTIPIVEHRAPKTLPIKPILRVSPCEEPI